jgi:anti-sigma B factor antagonist
MGTNVHSPQGGAMHRSYQQLEYHQQDDVFCVRLKKNLGEAELEQLSDELGRLIDEAGCRKMIISLGPGDLVCLYSVFLAKLITLQRRLEAVGGALVLTDLSPNTQEVFRATGLDRHFCFAPDQDSALRRLAPVAK